MAVAFQLFRRGYRVRTEAANSVALRSHWGFATESSENSDGRTARMKVVHRPYETLLSNRRIVEAVYHFFLPWLSLYSKPLWLSAN